MEYPSPGNLSIMTADIHTYRSGTWAYENNPLGYVRRDWTPAIGEMAGVSASQWRSDEALRQKYADELAIEGMIRMDRARRELFDWRTSDRRAYDATLQAMAPGEFAAYKRWEFMWQEVTGEYVPEMISGDARQVAYSEDRVSLAYSSNEVGQQPFVMGENFGISPDSPYWGMRYHGYLKTDEGDLPIVSFLYHKYRDDGTLETEERVIAVKGFASGKHKDHLHQPEGMFVAGIDIGRYVPPADGQPQKLVLIQAQFTAWGETEPMAVKYFSTDCIDKRPVLPDAPEPVVANPDKQRVLPN